MGPFPQIFYSPKGDGRPRNNLFLHNLYLCQSELLSSRHTHVTPALSQVLSLFPRIVLMDDAMDCLMSFSDFLFAFQIQFYYSGEKVPGPLWLLSGTMSPFLILLSFPSVCLAHTVPIPTSCRGMLHHGPLTGWLICTGGHGIQSAKPTEET